MARGRFISKDISWDEKVDALPDDSARLLFTWMIAHADSEGRLYGDASLVKSLVVPRRNYSARRVDKYLMEMKKLGLIERYCVGKNQYIHIAGFEKNQVGLRKEREAQSQIPPREGGVTPATLRSKAGAGPPQEEVEDKVKDKVKLSSSNGQHLAQIAKYYEENIGVITPAISEKLKEIAAEYPPDWFAEAVSESCKHNKRSLAYILRILESWRANGIKKSKTSHRGNVPSDAELDRQARDRGLM
ncbi:MAG: DnaD domain protein [Chloroflexota bacterium]